MSAPGTTPGPWKHFQAYNENHELIADRVIGADGYRIIDDVPLSADARLIAASPALYDALVEAREDILRLANARWSEVEASDAEMVDYIDVVLAQARGETA